MPLFLFLQYIFFVRLDSLLFFPSPLPVSAFLWLRDFVLPEGKGVTQASASGSLLYGTFWTVWERSTLLSRAVKRLTLLLVQAAIEVNTRGSHAWLFSSDDMLHRPTKLVGSDLGSDQKNKVTPTLRAC